MIWRRKQSIINDPSNTSLAFWFVKSVSAHTPNTLEPKTRTQRRRRPFAWLWRLQTRDPGWLGGRPILPMARSAPPCAPFPCFLSISRSTRTDLDRSPIDSCKDPGCLGRAQPEISRRTAHESSSISAFVVGGSGTTRKRYQAEDRMGVKATRPFVRSSIMSHQISVNF